MTLTPEVKTHRQTGVCSCAIRLTREHRKEKSDTSGKAVALRSGVERWRLFCGATTPPELDSR